MQRSLLLIGLLSLAACGETSGAFTQVALDVRAALPEAPNAHGWTVTLSRAEISLSSMRFYEGEPLFAAMVKEALHLAFGFREAHAHPGHYEEGAALAEWLTPTIADLLAGARLGDAAGVTGAYRSAELALSPSEALGGASVALEGVARRGEVEVPFSAAVDAAFDVVGISFGATVTDPAAQVHVIVDLGAWVDRMDFTEHPGGPLQVDGQPYNALARGISNTDAYRFELAAGSEGATP